MKTKPTKEYRCECGKLLDGTQYFNRETKKWMCGKCYSSIVPLAGEAENEKVKFYDKVL